ncbi:MAG: EFR1 family ferrodoxin [Candidatus Omnitrophica bacterium]|nr:EFR1 family ferrodoxin [Candidatus Omnitrophota bacterium]MDD5430464.1 EFR1 family ferrodoxin [Candidatus Omnitrophota bacterium]
MENIIFYFSGTGNSLQVARDLARELGNSEIVSIAKVAGREVKISPKRIGLVFPVYMFGIPLIVRDFLKRLDVSHDVYIFAVATFAGAAGEALGQANNELKARGLKLSSGFLIKMPGNYIPLYEAISSERQAKLFKKESQKVRKIAKLIHSGVKKKPEKSFFIFNIIGSAIYKNMSPRIFGLDKGFWADDSCNYCGICQKVCPVGNVKVFGKKPIWLHKCEQCFACLQWCPKGAIQYQKKTLFKRRYRNPNVSIEDFFDTSEN